MGKDEQDKKDPQRYCSKLGHILGFSYCQREKEGLPCGNIRNCWSHKAFLTEFLEKFKKEEIQYIYEPPGPKLPTLMEIVDRAVERLNYPKN